MTEKFRKREKSTERNARRNYLKQTEINTINQRITTIQQNYENNLKEVTEHQDDVK